MGGNWPPTKPFCLHLDVFQLAQLSRETLLRLSVSAAFLQSFSLPPWWTCCSAGWCTRQYNRSFCMLITKENWDWCLNRAEGAGENDALKNAFLPATWHGCLGSRFTRKSFPNTAVPVFITALMPTAPMVLVLLTCFLKHCSEQTVAPAVEVTLWLWPFLLAVSFPVVSDRAESLKCFTTKW